jgi:hypothetical protein
VVSDAWHILPSLPPILYNEGDLSDASGYHSSFARMIASSMLPLAAMAP